MAAPEDQFVTDLNKIVADINKNFPRVPGFIDGCCDALRWIIFWDHGWVEDRRSEAHTKFGELQTDANGFVTQCSEECSAVVDVKSLRGVADALEEIDWEKLIAQVNQATLMGDTGQWVSTNLTLYEAKIQPLEGKIRALKSALDSLIEAARTCDEVQQSYIIAGLNFTLGIILALAGLVVALATGWTGVGAIIGLIVAIASFIYALAQVALMPDVTGEIKSQADEVNKAAGVVDASLWPTAPSMTAGRW